MIWFKKKHQFLEKVGIPKIEQCGWKFVFMSSQNFIYLKLVCALSFSCVQLFVTSWIVDCQDTWDIIQVRILEWVAYSFSRAFSQPRNRTGVSCITGRFFTSWATREALNWYTFIVKYYILISQDAYLMYTRCEAFEIHSSCIQHTNQS